MRNEMVTAEQLMKRDLTAVMAEDTVEDAMHVLRSHSLSGVPVVDDQWRLVGFLSESDILRSVLPSYLEILAQDSFLYGEHELLVKNFRRSAPASCAITCRRAASRCSRRRIS